MAGGHLLLKAFNGTSYSDSISWSTDERIAVIADEFLYIITLKDATQFFHSNKPTVAISTIPVPSHLSTLKAPTKSPENIYYEFDATDNYDVFFDLRIGANNVTPVHFISAKWSPVGCSEHNRCVLNCLTNTNRVLIYCQLTSTEWTIAIDLSDVHYQNLVNYNFRIAENHTPTEDQPLSAIHEYHRQQSLLVATGVSWLPVLLDSSDGEGKVGVLAIAWRGGYVSLWSMKVPINESTVPSLIKMIPLHLDNGWVTTMEWSIADSLYLSAGCCTGQLLVLEWKLSLQERREELLKTNEPIMRPIWEFNDSMSIHHLAWSTQVNDGRWLLFSKGSYIFGVFLSISSSSLSPLLLGNFNLPLTGIAILNNNDVILCLWDGKVYRTQLPKGGSSFKPPSIELIHDGVKSCECSGIAVSKNNLYAVTCIHSAKKKNQITLLPLCQSNYTAFTSQLTTETCSWDLYQYLKQSPSLWVESIEPPLPLMIQRQISLLKQNSDRLSDIEQELLIEHSRPYLQQYMKWTDTIHDKLSLISISHHINFLLTKSGGSNPSDQILAKKAMSKLGQVYAEYCPICNEVIPYISYKNESCPNQHSWERCILTQCIITDLTCTVICSICSNKAISHSSTSWLNYVTGIFHTCPLCGGYFESLL